MEEEGREDGLRENKEESWERKGGRKDIQKIKKTNGRGKEG